MNGAKLENFAQKKIKTCLMHKMVQLGLKTELVK
jgi:hypothetical protein